MAKEVLIVGSGVVGSATGGALLAKGHSVAFIDKNPERCAVLKQRGLSASTSIALPPATASIVLVSVPTPSTNTGYDLTWLEEATRSIGLAIRESKSFHIVGIRSTVAPGVCANNVTQWLEESSGKSADIGFAVASVPEFLREESASSDAEEPWITVIGARNAAARHELMELFEPLGGKLHVFDDTILAETIKIIHNCYNATKISFWNEMWLLCENLGIDQREVGEVVAHSAEGSFNPLYGIRGGYPFGGACLPKDLDGLIGFGERKQIPMPLLNAVRAVNAAIADLTVSMPSADDTLAIA
jgi:UDPglucose 6-dehydrogenase